LKQFNEADKAKLAMDLKEKEEMLKIEE